MPLYRFIELVLVAQLIFSAGGNYMSVIDCLCVRVLF